MWLWRVNRIVIGIIIGVFCGVMPVAAGENIGSVRSGGEVIPILLPSDVPNLTVFPQSVWKLDALFTGEEVKSICVLWFYDISKAFHGRYPIESLGIAVICDSTEILSLAYSEIGEPVRYWIYIDGKPQECTKKEVMDFLLQVERR